MASSPELSAVLVTPRSYETIRKSAAHLRAQDIRDRIEIVIAVPSKEGLEPDLETLADFWEWQVVEVGRIDNLGPVVAECYKAARAQVVVYVEEHAFPAAGWAKALVQAHAGPWAAVGPAVTNANPESAVSWSALYLDFTESVAPAETGRPSTSLANHQTSYKRGLLLQYGGMLGQYLENESTLQRDLVEAGHGLYYEPAARTSHVNVSRFGEFLVSQFVNCREFGGNRARLGGWRWRRLLYVAGSPLIPVVRGRNVLREIRRSRLGGKLLLRMLPSLLLGLASAAAGEVTGYVLGKGDASRQRVTFELERLRHVTERDRREAAGS